MSWLAKLMAVLVVSLTLAASTVNLTNFIKEFGQASNDPSNFKNELAAVDYVYQHSDGKNFKVYSYLPSVIDYPYQYLFWWQGLKRYGFVPEDYAYLPNKPEYIKTKNKLPSGEKPPSSGLVFLVKQPDVNGRRHLWENDFNNLALVNKEIIGPLEIETRQEMD